MGSFAKRVAQAAIPDPDKPLTGLYHGSNKIGRETGMPFPAKGTDLTSQLDPSKASNSGLLGPAALYTTTHPEQARQYGRLYGVDISAPPKDFVEVDRSSGKFVGEAPHRIGNSPLARLLDAYEQTTGNYLPSDMTVRRVLQDVGIPRAKESVRGTMFDPDATNIEDLKSLSIDEVTNELVNHGGLGLYEFEDVLPEGAISDAYQNASRAYRDAVQGFVQQSGVAGFKESLTPYPHWEQGIPNIHYAVYDPAAIIRLIKLGLLPAVATGAASQGDKK